MENNKNNRDVKLVCNEVCKYAKYVMKSNIKKFHF